MANQINIYNRKDKLSGSVHVIDFQETADAIQKLLPNVAVCYFACADEITNHDDIEVLICNCRLAGSVAQKCANLKWYMCPYAGVDGLMRFCREKNFKPHFTISRFGGVLPLHMAEWVIARIIAHERHFEQQVKDAEQGLWNRDVHIRYRCLYELTIGIFGVGDIGSIIAERCKQFGMTVIGVGQRELRPEETPKNFDSYRSVRNFSEVFSSCDIICSVLPDTPQTAGFFDGEVLKPCESKKPIFMNIGRGSAVSNGTILRALESGWISHAFLDVAEGEPLPPDSPLWRHPKVTISPHVSARATGHETANLFVENYQRFLCGEKLKYEVDVDRGY